MEDDEVGGIPAAATVRAAWATEKPKRANYVEVVQESNTVAIIGERNVFYRGPRVPIMHLAYFKPPVESFFTKVKAKDRRSYK